MTSVYGEIPVGIDVDQFKDVHPVKEDLRKLEVDKMRFEEARTWNPWLKIHTGVTATAENQPRSSYPAFSAAVAGG